MQTSPKPDRFKKYKAILDIVFVLALLFMLGSCTTDINAIGGKIDGTREIAGVFFFYLLIIFPCLFAARVFFVLKLEKLLLSQEQRKQQDQDFQRHARKSLRKDFGLLSKLMNAFMSRADKKANK